MYEIREVLVRNGEHERSILVINFQDAKYDIVGEYLMTDAPMMNYRILEDIDQVLSGEKDELIINGNRCSLQIQGEKTYIEDLFDGLFEDFDTYDSLSLPTEELRELISMWREKTEEE